MAEWRTVRALGIAREGECYFHGYEEGPPGPGEFRVQTLYTAFSAGTELTFFKGTNPYLHSRWDEEFGLFRAGEPSAHFPVPFLGYMEVGRVTESRTPDVQEGDTVAMTYGHKTGHTANAAHDFFAILPPNMDPLLGIYVAQMGPICANGLLHAAADLVGQDVRTLGDGVRGRNVLVTGAGVVGLLIGLFAHHLGASGVVVADSTSERLDAARGLGLEALNEGAESVAEAVKARWHHAPGDRGADLVFQCRGQAQALAAALDSLRPQGTVIDLAFYQEGAGAVRLGEAFHHNGLTLRCAQIGRVPRGLAFGWTRQRLAGETIALLTAHGDAVRRHLITDIVPFDEAPTFIAALAARQRHAIQAVFQVDG